MSARDLRWLAVLCLACLAVPGAMAHDGGDDGEADDGYVVWYTLKAGGGVSSNSDVQVAGTVGQFDAGDLSSGEGILVSTGFWTPLYGLSSDGGDDDDDMRRHDRLAGSLLATVSGEVTAPAALASRESIREFSLQPIVPNPSPGEGTIAWLAPRTGRVRLTLHDVQGRVVAVLADGEYPAGRHGIGWSARRVGGLASGIYYVRLHHPEGMQTRRLVLTL